MKVEAIVFTIYLSFLPFFLQPLEEFLDRHVIFYFRKIALVIILTRAGLGLDAGVLRKHYAAVLQLGLLPWLIECVAIGVSTHYLINLPWMWSKNLSTLFTLMKTSKVPVKYE